MPIMADIQFAALACGADPFKIVQLQWHASPCEEVVEKMGLSRITSYNVCYTKLLRFAALACGADPFKIVQLQWHASPCEDVVEKMGVSWSEAKARFEEYLKEVKAGKIEYLYKPELAAAA